MSILLLSLALALLSDPDDDVWDAKETREVQAKYGDCVVKKSFAAARTMVLDPNLEGRDWRRAFQQVADGMCLIQATSNYDGIEMKFPLDTMRYALADALVRREFASRRAPSFEGAAPLEHPTWDESKYQPEPGKKSEKADIEALEKSRAMRIGRIFLSGFGECVVRANPNSSRALLMARPDTPDERAAFQSLMPQFSDCLPAGQKLEFNKATLRGTVAMNFYRLAHAPRVTATSAGASK